MINATGHGRLRAMFAARGQRADIRRGAVLHHAGEAPRHAWLVTSGWIGRYRTNTIGDAAFTGIHIAGDVVALDAAQMLGTPAERARIRICASGTCSARFYDRSPAGRRRWCSMQACGNVEKARRHRARHPATRPEGIT